ncbi:MAG: hypothetical protein BroJett018_21260 [Chloroflexota bacterium]|nr:DNA-binding response regulator [Chloroflexota bacterium]NOG65419.1 response regulator transcription factor [Chloroflexota bacterium]GIK64332.1 MAG: hypothetical protein BroJett018_21260 [Chloroflexota bacterium]
MNFVKHPHVIAATGYPLHGDAIRAYLSGFYEVETVGHNLWQDGLAEIDRQVQLAKPAAVIVDDTFPYEPQIVARRIKSKLPACGLIYVDANPNIFRVLHCLEEGFVAYLFLGDQLGESLKLVVDMARRGERFLSPHVLGLYERYTLYRGLFTGLPNALLTILKLMGEGLSVQQMVVRTGLRPEVIYRRQYRLRQHFGVENNEALLEVIQGMFDDKAAALAKP